jgi:ApaG protein
MQKANIHISAVVSYLPEQSSHQLHNYVWSYKITIVNESEQIIQLLNRYWRIIDGNGRESEAQGPGVVGLQPLIKPGSSFVYESFCQLETPEGSMEGYYEFQTLQEEHFLVEIPKFTLSATEGQPPECKNLH